MSEEKLPEPWLRGTFEDVPAVPRAVLHALELASEDIQRWCGCLTDAELNARPMGVPPVAFHVRHIVRSADRLLTYAEGRALTDEQMAALRGELEETATGPALFTEFRASLEKIAERVRAFRPAQWEEPSSVGRRRLPTTVGGLLVHVGDHTQRHTGQAITTAKIVLASRR